MSLDKRMEKRIKGVKRANMKWYHWLFINNWMLSAMELDNKYSNFEEVEVYEEFSLKELSEEENTIEIEDEYGDLYAIGSTRTGTSYACGDTDVEEEIEEILEIENNEIHVEEVIEIVEEIIETEENNGGGDESFYGGDDNSGGYDGDSGGEY